MASMADQAKVEMADQAMPTVARQTMANMAAQATDVNGVANIITDFT